jgi:hypothetical protein
LSGAAGEAERRRRARARKAEAAAAAPVVAVRPWWPEIEAALVDCPDSANHKVCPVSGGGHDWYKPHPRPADHKYQCLQCGHYDLDDYR